MEDYEKELLADLGSDSSDEEQSDILNHNNVDHNTLQPVEHISSQDTELEFEQKLKKLLNDEYNYSLQDRLEQFDITNVKDITQISKIYPIIPDLQSHIEIYSSDDNCDYLDLLSSVNNEKQNEEYSFILMVNELSQVIHQEISLVHSFIKLQYKVVFAELETLVLNPIDYANIVLLIKQDITNIKKYESELMNIVSNEKVLIIIMSAMQHIKDQFVLNNQDFEMIIKACRLVIDLNNVLSQLSEFISSKLSKFAPNVSAIVGPITTSQLLIASGSLRQLSLTASCNLPSLGVRDLSSQKTNKSVRQTGYLYHCELIKYLPPSVVRSAMRILSGKVILAARIDLSQSCPSGSLGEKYLEEVTNKIEKLLTPPEAQGDKALPAPVEHKSKKRGGRRFRKMKERFQMSELRKAQNKMEFGKQEESVIDSFGEEVGLGMSRGGAGRLNIQLNTNTNAKMSKSLTNRLQLQKVSNNVFNDDFDSILLTNNTNNSSNMVDNNERNDSNKSKWFTGMVKRKREEDTAEPSETKKLKF
ncbi:uncharacterized protein AC631_00629 [Debaryomyces fabryi]|uniref:Nop domain-containing protein n=1 Tax=Debaryomyces fabryi TaxID=58627 RepID=A0A0V1Q5J2_9ASCO|nr:uncharacterized protein AC631_00629 [Debaryomyces fabryi]KSA03654.1 hypothetical protein AC631_00629 [Debaryomyces fabryi]CUM52623.1 unnamed protein product [Debaryomyces fabryi]